MELFLGLLVGCWGYYLDQSYYLLAIVLICWYTYLHQTKQVIVLVLLSLCFGLALYLPKPSFENHQTGEIVYLNQSGFQVGKTFYYGKTEELQVGDIVSLQGEETIFPEMNNPGGFDEKHFLMGKGVTDVAYLSTCEVLSHRLHLKEIMSNIITSRNKPALKDIYQYLLLGISEKNIRPLQEQATNLGILHIFAISGMHFALLSQLFRNILSYFMDENKSSYLTLFLMGLYAFCLQGNIAAWRAYLTMLLKKVTPFNQLQCFGLIGCFFILYEPQIIFNMAFIFSMSIYFLVLLSAEIRFGTIFVYLGTMIISSYFQYEIYPLSFLFSYIFTIVIGFTFPLFFLDVVLGGLLGGMNSYLYQGLLVLMDKSSHLSQSVIVGKPPFLYLIIFYLALVVVLYQWQFYHRKSYMVILPCLVFCQLCFPYFSSYGKVVMVDVGQGDCFLLQLPHQEANLLIDTGGLVYQDVATKRIIPLLKSLGIKQLDAIYISHDDEDHAGALESLQEHFKVEKVVWDFEEDHYSDVTLKQLNWQEKLDANDDSQVIYTELGKTKFLFCGDISIKRELRLLAQYPDLRADVLKVAHHGSGSSTSEAFLTQLQPKVALVSVGKNNLYHHPSPNVIMNLEAHGCLVLRTDLSGAQIIYFNDQDAWLEKTKKG